MRKKILDILPPQSSQFEKIPEKSPREKGKKSKGRLFKVIPLKYLLIALCLFGFSFVTMAVAGIYSEMTLKLEFVQKPIEKSQQIEVNVSQVQPDFDKGVIPGEIFEHQKDKWKTFPASGKTFKEEKARGTIRVFNTYTPSRAVNLVANTRFLSSPDGKIFRALKKIHLPPATTKNGKVVPSSVEIEVEAAEPGEEYNIGPSKFSVPGLSGTPLYYSIWAESTKNIEGGSRKEVKKVLQNDLDGAHQALLGILRTEGTKGLKAKIPNKFLLGEKAISEESSQVSCFAKPEDKVPDFRCQGTIKLKGFGVAVSALRKFGQESIKSELPLTQELRPDTLTFDLAPKTILWEQGKMILDVNFRAKTYKKIDSKILLSQIQGKSKSEIQDIIFKNYPQVKKIEFNFWPFWIKTAPSNLRRIKIRFDFGS